MERHNECSIHVNKTALKAETVNVRHGCLSRNIVLTLLHYQILTFMHVRNVTCNRTSNINISHGSSKRFANVESITVVKRNG